MTRIGILLSGRGSNFLAIHDAITRGNLPGCEIVLVLSNKVSAPGLAAAQSLGIDARFLSTRGLAPEARDQPFLTALAAARVDLVCLAGYMRLISPAFVAAFPARILNVHPSLLPAFPGLEAQTRALDFGAKIAGCTVHFVDEQVDHGVIILQRAVAVLDDDTAETLSARILAEEHQAYPEAIRRVLSGSHEIRERRFSLKPQRSKLTA